jgi:HD superfamily phosphohydrolase
MVGKPVAVPEKSSAEQPLAGEPRGEASSFRQAEYLSGRDHPLFRIRCPVHGFIHFSENERQVIDHPLFRRLRWVRQLALTDYIYPGATHTRFEHCLGVMEVATRAFDRLASRHGSLLERTFQTVEGMKDRPLAKGRQLLRLAALLHDVGHACFSHAAEEVIHRGAGHEELTVRIIAEPDFLGRLLDERFFAGCAGFVARVIKGGPDLPPQLKILQDLVSGQIDADRTDYLLRDSLHCGVDYGRFDYRRMIECLELREGEAGVLEMALHQDGIHTFEALILARYQMNTQVYYHRLRRIYDLYLREYFKAKGETFLDTPEKILQHNDVTMTAAILQDADRPGHPAQKWAERIRDRRHHREVFKTSEAADALDLRRAKEVLNELQGEYRDLDFQWDQAKPSIHKLLVPGDKDEKDLVRFPVVGPGALDNLVGEKSHILQHVPREFQVGRIFCDLTREQKGLRQEISQRAHHLYRQKGGRS